jgi:hypothetical protein
MKYIILCASLFLFQNSWSQESMKDFFTNKTQVVFLGMDFTQARFIGKDKFPKVDGLKNHAIKEWNRFLATEPGKYSLKEAFKLKDKNYYNSINYFTKRNQKIDVESKIIDSDYSLSEDEVVKNVAEYNTFEKEGLAVSFVVESFNAKVDKAYVWVCFIDLPSNKIIYMEKMVGNGGGMGQVNFWARAMYSIVSQIEKRADEFKKK